MPSRPNNRRRPRARTRRSPRQNSDSRVWNMPITPSEYSQGTFPFSIIGTFEELDMAKDAQLTYSRVLTWLVKRYLTSATSLPLSIQVHKVGVYGPTQVSPDRSASTVVIEDAYTGRTIIGTASVTARSRAGFIAAPLRRMKWYDSGSTTQSLTENVIAYVRSATVCPGPANAQLYSVVISGIARISSSFGLCTFYSPEAPPIEDSQPSSQ